MLKEPCPLLIGAKKALLWVRGGEEKPTMSPRWHTFAL